MEINVTTPALLFPAISLLLLAYTNRFLTLANLIRDLHARYKKEKDELIPGQIANLRYRVNLIRDMQAFGVLSLLLCVVCMFTLFAGWELVGRYIFGVSLILMMVSLGLSLREIQVSVGALNLRLVGAHVLRRAHDMLPRALDRYPELHEHDPRKGAPKPRGCLPRARNSIAPLLRVLDERHRAGVEQVPRAMPGPAADRRLSAPAQADRLHGLLP